MGAYRRGCARPDLRTPLPSINPQPSCAQAEKHIAKYAAEIVELKAELNRITEEIEEVILQSGAAPIRGGGCLVYDKSVLEVETPRDCRFADHGCRKDYDLEGRVGKGGQATIAKGYPNPSPNPK